jgi:AcrR family transcriptional regulator
MIRKKPDEATAGKSPPADAAEDMVIASLGTMTRGSEAMFARRRRILNEARRMLGEEGSDLSMRELARRSAVSLRTLYNAFGSKESLIAAAIRQYFDKFLRAISDGRDTSEFDWALSAMIAINLRNRQIRPYLNALVGLYFSTAVDPAIRDELRQIAAGFMRPWFDLARARKQLRIGVDIDRAIGNIANLQYALNQEWLLGDIQDDGFVPAILEAVLSYLDGATRGVAQAAIDRLLVDLRVGRLAPLIAGEEERLRLLFDKPGDYWPADGDRPTESAN